MQLRFDRVSAGYGRLNVLRDVNLVVPEGSAVALLGPNGAGKSTLLLTAAGQVRPRRGHVFFDETPVDRWRPSDRSKAGLCLIPEGRGIFRLLTVGENLAMQAGGRTSMPPSSGPLPPSRSSARGSTSSPGRSRADSSRCWPSPGRSSVTPR